jgi:hypothetical protein
MAERRSSYRVMVEKTQGGKPMEGPGINGTIILKRFFEK